MESRDEPGEQTFIHKCAASWYTLYTIDAGFLMYLSILKKSILCRNSYTRFDWINLNKSNQLNIRGNRKKIRLHYTRITIVTSMPSICRYESQHTRQAGTKRKLPALIPQAAGETKGNALVLNCHELRSKRDSESSLHVKTNRSA